MGGPERFRQIVDNLAALVAELDRTLVPAIEAVSGPAPDWYKPKPTALTEASLSRDESAWAGVKYSRRQGFLDHYAMPLGGSRE